MSSPLYTEIAEIDVCVSEEFVNQKYLGEIYDRC